MRHQPLRSGRLARDTPFAHGDLVRIRGAHDATGRRQAGFSALDCERARSKQTNCKKAIL